MKSEAGFRKCVIGLAIAVFVMGWVVVLPPAVAKGGFVVYDASKHTYAVWPTGGDDTANIQAALDACATDGPGCIVQLEKGVFHTRQIAVFGLQGKFRGMGERWTTVEALPDLPSPAVNPFWIDLPGPENPWPDMFVFVDGSFTISDMTFTNPYEVPTQGWQVYGMTFYELHGVLFITGEHAHAVIDHVTLRGAAGNFFGTNMINGIVYEGILLPPEWTDPYAVSIPLTGTLLTTNSAFYRIDNQIFVAFLLKANVEARCNTFDTTEYPFAFLDVSDSVLDFSGNRASNVFGIGGVVGLQGLFRSALLPSQILVRDNDLSVMNGAAGVLLVDYGAEKTLDADVSSNYIYADEKSGGGIVSVSMKSMVVTGNEIRGAGPLGVYVFDSAGVVRGNEIRSSAVGVWVDASADVLVRNNEIKDSAQWGIALTSGSSGNSIIRNEVKNSGAYDLYWDQTGSGNVWRNNEYKTSDPPGL